METTLSFGQIVRERRTTLGLTQAELARRANCASVTVRKIEGDALRPSVQLAELLAISLKIPENEHQPFIRLARQEKPPTPLPRPTPSAGEIGIADLSGRAVRGFQLGERIGSGGFGVVYQAVQPSVQREVAVKIILPRFANQPEFIRRFEVEAQLVGRLEHPHIVPLYDYWREPDAAYLIMRLLRGGSLQTRLGQGPLPLERFHQISHQIGLALASAHVQKVIHRDIKPANVLLDGMGNAYLADFGIAKDLLPAGNQETAMLDADIVTPAYLSPEQIQNEPIKPASDIYSFAMLLYEMLTGEKPFQGPTVLTLLQQHLEQPMPSLTNAAPGLPAGLDAVLQRAGAKKPQDRFQNVSDLLAALDDTLRPKIDTLSTAAVLSKKDIVALENPFRGLRSFTEADGDQFFGRDALVHDLLGMLADETDLERFVAVVGPSGSGKSSVVRAGLIPAIRRGGLPGSENWFIVDFTPGDRPWENLAAALQRISVENIENRLDQLQNQEKGIWRVVSDLLPVDGETELLLVIDQFEELFTQVQDEEVRASFLDSLVTAVLEPRSRLHVLITLRVDLIDRPLQYVDIGELLHQRLAVVLPLTPDEITQVITKPVENLGMSVAHELVATIIRDLGEQPGMLPLLQYALTEVFAQRSGNILTLAEYEAAGGVIGALAKRADEIFAGLDAEGQEIAQQLFLRLVTLGEGGRDTRRRVARSELQTLLPAHGASTTVLAVDDLIDLIGQHRLLTFDHDPVTRNPTVEVAHEALLREWPRLRDWLTEARADLLRQRTLNHAAQQWLRHDREDSYLLRGSRLMEHEAWSADSKLALTVNENAFLQASIAVRDARLQSEKERQELELETAQRLAQTEHERAEAQTQVARTVRQRSLILSWALVVVVILAIIAVGFARSATTNADLAATREAETAAEAAVRATAEAVAISERENALEQTRLTRSRELALSALASLGEDPELSILLAMAGLDTAFTREAEEALHRAVLASQVRLRMEGHGNGFSAVTFNHDDTRIAAASWGGDEENFFGTVYVWDAVSGDNIFTLDHFDYPPNNLVFSPDGSEIYLALEGNQSGGLVSVINSRTGETVREIDVMPAGIQSADTSLALWTRPMVCCLAISPDGKNLVTGHFDLESVTGTVWDLESGEALFTLPDFGDMDGDYFLFQEGPHYSPDGRFISGASANHRATVWDATTGEIVFNVSHVNDTVQDEWRKNVTETQITPDGNRLITIGNDGFIRIWQIDTGDLEEEIDAPTFILWGLDVSPDGTQMATNSVDGSVHLWDLNNGELIRTLKGHQGQSGNIAFSANGARLASVGDGDGNILVWDILPNEEVRTFVQEPYVDRVSFTADGELIASSNGNGSVKVWNVQSGEQFHDLAAHEGWVGALDFSPDGSRLASGSGDEAKIWDMISGELLLSLPGHGDSLSRLAYSPDGAQVATVSFDGFLRIWDSGTGDLTQSFELADEIFFVDYHPDGTRIVTGTANEGAVQVWDLNSGEELFQIDGNTILVKPFFSASGRLLLFDDGNGATAYIHDGATGALQTTIATGKTIVEMAASPDDATLFVGHSDGTVTVWDVESGRRRLTLFSEEGFDQRPYIHPDGDWLAVSSGQEGLVRIYTLNIEELLEISRSRLTRDFSSAECLQYRINDCAEN